MSSPSPNPASSSPVADGAQRTVSAVFLLHPGSLKSAWPLDREFQSRGAREFTLRARGVFDGILARAGT